MIRQSDNVVEINAVATEATGRNIDVSDIMRRSGVIVLLSDHGLIVFVPEDKGVYCINLAIRPDSRGADGVQMIRDMFSWMFENTDADRLVGEILKTNKACLALVPLVSGGELSDFDDNKKIVVYVRPK